MAKKRPNIAKNENQKTLPTTTIFMSILLLAGSAWASSQGYPNAGQMLFIFAVVGAITATIPIATNDKFVLISVTLGSTFLVYYMMQDVMIAGLDELIELMFNLMFEAAANTTLPPP